MAAQKTLTIRGERFTARKIDALMSADNMTNGDDYIVTLNGDKYFANYRQIQDAHFAPVCDRDDANAIALMPDNGTYRWTIWLDMPPATPAAALGSITSDKKAASSRANGKLGGRPPKTQTTTQQETQMMNATQARELATLATHRVHTDGDDYYPVKGTVTVGHNKDGYWVTDNGEEVNGLTKEQAIEIIVKNLTN